MKLDTEKFRKVHALMTGGVTEGERAAARARAATMAKRAGMTLDEAVSGTDATPSTGVPQGVRDIFAGFADFMEKKEPGYKAREAAKRAARDARDDTRRAEVLARYGTEAALFARNEFEAALDRAIAPLATWAYWTDTDGVEHRHADTLEGKRPICGLWRHDDVTPAIRDAVARAYPWPSTLDSALREVQAWDRLRWDRGLFCDAREWNHYAEAKCRIALLEHELEAGRPAASWQDVQARLAWKRYEFERQWIEPTKRDDPFLDRLEADVAALSAVSAAQNGQALQPHHRNTADKRRDVLSMLDSYPEMSDREIARRCGVSPTTVGKLRRMLES
ncbi:hypothetical protein FHS55_001572 [Angulomicrobium tetraedrale]|uniref:Winged helix-turn-helix domain-containing protein n=1 Tax=Ancylobacter tetraedralis TaxID=217068 RepID=A0A839Z9I1_9HYPH|nr:winged helix-turn-helix domain-containing protein [Ancylobacter tetraedralis]MBB3770977.1 hypothetical protein [Ancylobacter tetraedralis]